MTIFLEMYLWTRKILLNFGSHQLLNSDPGIIEGFNTGRWGIQQ